ncbi:hypothetical protein LUZ61_015321 [Rhynchospora tenuis]|uniref:BTB domain-containing protein n=1 Tax=Rhynchospora tenuis TaxID=198213 RepID=A0AAD5WCP9_9POAL|nr:hypothetical protein LUZ61_015321 [Rhynchospora tenuis]
MISFLHKCTVAPKSGAVSCKRMVSTCADDTDFISTHGTAHRFIVNYKETKNLSNSECITSPTFRSDGYKWSICCYPKGSHKDDDNNNIGLFLELLSDYINLHVSFTLAIMDKSGSEPLQKNFNEKFGGVGSNFGLHCFIRRTTLEQGYLTKDGNFRILCFIKVLGQDFDGVPQVPIGGLKEDINKLWESGEMTDVNFDVEGEIISAHRVILSARSCVFKAELFGNMAEAKSECIRIDDMNPEVFRALLHFMYNDSLDNERETHHATIVMTQHILAAADRYEIEDLIVRCEKYLTKNLSVSTVMDVLMFAERHYLVKLKEACLEFASRQDNFIDIAFTDGYIEMAHLFGKI